MEWLGQPGFLSLPNATVICCGFAILMLVWNTVSLITETSPIHSALNNSIIRVKTFSTPITAKDIGALNAYMSQDKYLGESWDEFYETLLRPEKNTNPDDAVQNTRQANELINLASILGHRVSVSWYAAVPSLLTAIGLTGQA